MTKFWISYIMLIIITFYTDAHCKIKSIHDLLFPIPLHLSKGDKTIVMNKDTIFHIKYNDNNRNSKLEEIIEIYDSIINDNNKLLNIYNSEKINIVEIMLIVKNPIMKRYSSDYTSNNEEYNIRIKESKEKTRLIDIEIEAFYLNGLIYGLETLSQILNFNENSTNAQYELHNVPIYINDKPRFGYRGLLIDTSRHYISINKIKKIINGLMYNKMNILHWHILDDEYFGFGSDMLKVSKYTYTKSQIKDIINYADIRGITVVLEIDNPSHTKSWKDLYYNNKKISDLVLVKPEYGILDPSKKLTYKIVVNLIREALEIYSNPDEDNERIIIHLGGDEVQSDMWSIEDVKNFMKKHGLNTVSQLENFYFNKIRKKLPIDSSYIYWVSDQAREVYDVYSLDNSILMYWGIQANIFKFLDNLITNNNFKEHSHRDIILASGDYLYLDCGLGNKYGDDTWCGGYKTWKTIYSFPLIDAYKNFNIIGSEATLFGELADENSIIGKIFPRINSLSEILWNSENKVKDIKSFFYRLLIHNRRLIKRDIEVISITSQLCEDDPEQCIDNIK